MIKKFVYIISVFIVGCTPQKENLDAPIVIDLKLNCDKLFYTNGNNGTIVAFQIYYENQTDYNFIFDDGSSDALPNTIISLDVTSESRGFVFKDNDASINLIHESEIKYIKLKPKTKSYFYLFLYNRLKEEDIRKGLSFSITYNGAKPDLLQQVSWSKTKTILIQNSTIGINMMQDSMKVIKVTKEDLLYERRLDKL